MTDINNWPSLIRVERIENPTDALVNAGREVEYIVVPLNEYQMGNLLSALRSILKSGRADGDWWGEIRDIILVAMERLGIESLTGNDGRIYTATSIRDGTWLE